MPWKQCYVTTLLSSMNSACAQRWACRPSEAFLYQTFFAGNVVSCICRGMHWQSNQFQMSKNINAGASNLIRKAKFIVTVVGPVTLLSTDAASTVNRFREHNVIIAIANLCHSLTSHHACTSAAANEKSWFAQWTTQMVPWVVRNNFGLSDIKILNPKLYILITKNPDMDLSKRISRFASRTCSWEYLGRPTVLWVAFGDRATT